MMQFRVIHLWTQVVLFVGTLEECQLACESLKQGDFVILPL